MNLPPLSRYFAARCLLREGDATGASLLLQILDEVPADADTPDAASGRSTDALAIRASRRLLAWLTGKSQATDKQEFAAALRSRSRDLSTHLPPAPVF